MGPLELYDKVAAGEITPEEAANRSMAERNASARRQPAWMPRWAWIVVVVVVALVLGPILNTSNNERRNS